MIGQRTRSPIFKRLMDILFSAIGLVLLGPLMLLAAAVIRLSSPGPVFYVAKRAGLHGRAFGLLKFRTMQVGADRLGACTAQNDSRVFAAGRILRLFKIDELPQLINVLRGEMSIVGPRPEDWQIVHDCYTPEQRRVLEVVPGLTASPKCGSSPNSRKASATAWTHRSTTVVLPSPCVWSWTWSMFGPDPSCSISISLPSRCG